jgi:hypothetical protein
LSERVDVRTNHRNGWVGSKSLRSHESSELFFEITKPPNQTIQFNCNAGEIDVTFNSEGKPNHAEKTVTVVANTTPTNTMLLIKGEVTPKQGSATQAH